MPDCPNCASQRAQVGLLHGQLNQLQQRYNQLAQRLSILAGGVTSTVNWASRELDKATMPRQQVLPYLVERLNEVLRSAL